MQNIPSVNPEPKLTQNRAVKPKEQKGVTPIPFLNPDPMAQLVGCTNEASVVMDGHEMAALVDLGAQVSTISAQLCEELGLKVQPLGWLFGTRGNRGASIPYLRFVEVNLQIPGIRRYNRMCCFEPSPPMAYAERVLVVWAQK